MRLNSDDRRSIIKSALAHSFDKADAENQKALIYLGDKIYNSVFDASLIARIEKLPSKWFVKRKHLRFNLFGFKADFHMVEDKPVPISMWYIGDYHSVPSEEFRDEFVNLDNKRTELKRRREEAGTYLTGLLSRVYTLSKLEQVWPEGKQFYSQLEPAQRSEVPAIQVSDLNKLLGL